MTVADELMAFVVPNGVPCRIAALTRTHPAEHADLMEAIAATAKHTVVSRWWNATRAERTGVSLNSGTVSRHRGPDRCPQCR